MFQWFDIFTFLCVFNLFYNISSENALSFSFALIPLILLVQCYLNGRIKEDNNQVSFSIKRNEKKQNGQKIWKDCSSL